MNARLLRACALGMRSATPPNAQSPPLIASALDAITSPPLPLLVSLVVWAYLPSAAWLSAAASAAGGGRTLLRPCPPRRRSPLRRPPPRKRRWRSFLSLPLSTSPFNSFRAILATLLSWTLTDRPLCSLCRFQTHLYKTKNVYKVLVTINAHFNTRNFVT